MKMETLQDVYLEELRDLYDAEQQLLKIMPKMAKAASSPDLKAGFEDHLETSNGQVQRLEQIFERHDAKAKGKKCLAMKGLIEEAKECMEEDADEETLDVMLIIAAQKVEHYEIAGYGSVRTLAELLGHDEDKELLQESLDEEKDQDDRLSELAESINVEAMDESEETEEAHTPAGKQ